MEAMAHQTSDGNTTLSPRSDRPRSARPGSSGTGHDTLGRYAAFGVLLVVSLILSACNTPVFDPRAPRSQFDRFDAARDEIPAESYFDEFGRKRPNLRGLLLEHGT